MTNYITVITTLEGWDTESYRQYLRTKAEPESGMRCRPDFRFDLIPSLHFASFIILEATDDFGPRLVFEATFDGSRTDFVSDLLRVAGAGMHELYRHCTGWPACGLATPKLLMEYLIDHDRGAHIYFSGSPGRSVAEIRNEGGLHSKIVSYFSQRQPGAAFAPRLDGLFVQLRGFIAGQKDSRWAEQQAPVTWEVRFRRASVVALVIAALALACLIGAVWDWVTVAYGHKPLLVSLKSAFEEVGRIGGRWVIQIAPNLSTRLFLPIGLAGIWLVLRIVELIFTSWSKHPRDQFFIKRVPIHTMIILRYGVLAFFIGAVLLAIIPNLGTLWLATRFSTWLAHSILLLLLVVLVVVLLFLQYLATSLKILVEVKKLNGPQENLRRLGLDLVRFAMVIVISCGALIISRYVPAFMTEANANELVYRLLLIAAYGLIGAIILYALFVLLLVVAHTRELADRRHFSNPVALEARTAQNAKKYKREEGGNNRYQNHLASLTLVKPGWVHGIALRGTLFVINLLSRFWFNVGTLGDIPTILSARWVLIDRGRRLLFLDNYGGAWDSYLNEFIDMTAVKGLNAIWTNTFVQTAPGKRWSFPETRFYFWQGAQAERPFKAYVRESQIETIVWYSAYPSLSVGNINTSTAVRQSLSKPLVPSGVDAIVQNL
ncbi:MFS family permease [Bradyrhizobium diazoefficiens]